jgi:hypothetical protein
MQRALAEFVQQLALRQHRLGELRDLVLTHHQGSHAPAHGLRAHAGNGKRHAIHLLHVDAIAAGQRLQERPFAVDHPAVLVHQRERHAHPERRLVQGSKAEAKAAPLLAFLQDHLEDRQLIPVQKEVTGHVANRGERSGGEGVGDAIAALGGNMPFGSRNGRGPVFAAQTAEQFAGGQLVTGKRRRRPCRQGRDGNGRTRGCGGGEEAAAIQTGLFRMLCHTNTLVWSLSRLQTNRPEEPACTRRCGYSQNPEAIPYFFFIF